MTEKYKANVMKIKEIKFCHSENLCPSVLFLTENTYFSIFNFQLTRTSLVEPFGVLNFQFHFVLSV